jgi:uncharacterized protein
MQESGTLTSTVRKRGSLWAFFILAFLFTWSFWVPQALYSRGIISFHAPGSFMFLAGYGPALSALIITLVYDGKAGLKSLLRRLGMWRVGLKWYAIALLLPAAISLAGLAMYFLLGNPFPAVTARPAFDFGFGSSPVWIQFLLLTLMFILGFDGFGEELGWRGYALPVLLKKYAAFMAALFLGVIWALWHLPYALTIGSAMSGQSFFKFLPGILGSSVLITWIFSNTKGSVLLAILFHAAGNITYNALPILVPVVSHTGMAGTIVQWVVIALITVIEGPKYLSRKKALAAYSENENKPAIKVVTS